jgi:hypothetical protein
MSDVTDIVERLYRLHEIGCPDARCAEAIAALSEAAGEIGRLRGEKDNWKAEARSMHALLFKKDHQIGWLYEALDQISDLGDVRADEAPSIAKRALTKEESHEGPGSP